VLEQSRPETTTPHRWIDQQLPNETVFGILSGNAKTYPRRTVFPDETTLWIVAEECFENMSRFSLPSLRSRALTGKLDVGICHPADDHSGFTPSTQRPNAKRSRKGLTIAPPRTNLTTASL
jgi:hypothetical protein